MKHSRRHFLNTLGGAAILGAVSAGRANAASARAPLDDSTPGAFWRSVRARYPLSDRRIYFNTAGLGPAPERVLRLAETKRRELQGEAETARELFEEARPVVARFLGADNDEIAFTRNATEGNSIIAAGLPLARGDEVIFESHAHPGGSFPWLNQQKRNGVVVRVFEPSIHSPEENIARIRALINPRTRVIQLSHVTAPTGILFPSAGIAEIAREAGIWLHLDAAQSVGMIPIDVRKLRCDSLATSGHKWLGAPHETGILYVSAKRLPEVALAEAGAHSDAGYALPTNLIYAGSARRFEYGTRDAAAVLAIAEACRFQDEIGRERIAAHGRALAEQASQALAAIDGVEVLTPQHPDLRASITTFRMRAVPCQKLFGFLLEKHHLRCRPVSEEGLDAIRVAPHVFNNSAEIDTLVDAVGHAARELG